MSDPTRFYWDTCCFVSLISQDPHRLPTLLELMRGAQAGKIQIFTSTFTIAEVGFATHEKEEQKVDPDVEERIKKLWRPPTPVQLVEFHQFTAEESRLLMRDGLAKGWTGLKGKDAVHLATAKLVGVDEFHTYDDAKLAKYSEMIKAEVRQPWTMQAMLDLTTGPPSPPTLPFGGTI
jgi:predicted nucleic acid-binding protein